MGEASVESAEKKKVAVLIGSLRAASYSRAIANGLIARAPDGLDCDIVEIGDLPMYNQDLDDDPPQQWTDFRTAIGAHDAVLFVTPEYNRSIPGCLKNAVDIGSRPEGRSVWSGLPAGVVSVTPYRMGAFGANHALRQTFVFLDMPVMQQPEAYIGNVADLLDYAGQVTGKGETLLRDFMQAFARWIDTVSGSGTADFARFMIEREQVSNAYISGDAPALRAIVTDHEPATFFGPDGGCARGVEEVTRSFDKGAEAFEAGSTGCFDVLQSHASGDLAFWTGHQRAEVHMKGKPAPVPMTLRTTEIFRREDGEWKLIHRHADFGKDKPGG
jgi:NAD(P)H-dependent FMN reductase/ketosteroid isomerase-like protein